MSDSERKGTAVIIACSAKANPAQGVIARTRVHKDDEKDEKNDGPGLNPLGGVIADASAAYALFLHKLNFDIGGWIVGVEYKQVNKKKAVSAMSKTFASRKHTDVIIYYSGHGLEGKKDDSHGAWCFADEKGNCELIKPKDVFRLWRDANRNHPMKNRRLFIISDSCFSGQWVVEAKRYPNIRVQAACRPDERSFDSPEGGNFTHNWALARVHAPFNKLNIFNPLALSVNAFSFPFSLVTEQWQKHTPTTTDIAYGEISYPIGKSYLHFFAGWAVMKNWNVVKAVCL